MSGFFSRESIVADPGFNRWQIPPAALCIHLCIGQAYAFSVFNKPMTRVLGITESAPGDWDLATLGWIFTLAMVFLGLSAAFAGNWVERVGPRVAMLTSACCFAAGFFVSAAGVATHSLFLTYLGYGVLGGIGLGIGYISPVKTLIRWFPDRPGMATGMAIMGFGGGAMIGSPLAVNLMNYFATPEAVGVVPTFITMGIIYFCFMIIGALIVRVPADGWEPEGYVEPATARKMVTRNTVTTEAAMRTPQFWLVWAVLFLNVTAGIGVLGQASVMAQEMLGVSAAAAAGFVGLMSLANMLGRFCWASFSDVIGRKMTYTVFFVLGIALYALVPVFAGMGSVALFVLAVLVIISMYGGGFATVPAYLRDLFGTAHVGAIHGRLLTAWAAAGVAGPVILNYMREYQIETLGVAPANAYTVTLYIMAGLLVIGLLCNLAIREVASRHHSVPEADGVRTAAAT